MKKTLPKCALIFLLGSFTSFADPTAEKLEGFREERQKEIEAFIQNINEKHLKALRDLKTKTDLGSPASDLIQNEIEELESLQAVVFPDELKFPELGVGKKEPFKKPKIRREEDVAKYLVGTKWEFWRNSEFLGDSEELIFLNEQKVSIAGKEYLWKVKTTSSIWIANDKTWGGTNLSFSDKSYQRLSGALANLDNRRSAQRK